MFETNRAVVAHPPDAWWESSHRRPRIIVRWRGETKNLSAWATELHEWLGSTTPQAARHTLALRLRQGWEVDEALTTAFGRGPGARAHADSRWLREDVPYEQDLLAQTLVAARPGGMTLDEVGLWAGITRERVRQIQDEALAKLRAHGASPLLARLMADLREAVQDEEEWGQPEGWAW